MSCASSLALDAARGFGEPDLDHLPRIVPLVDGGRGVEPFVALQANQRRASARREHLGDFRLADARLAFEEQRPPQRQREEHRRREPAIGDVVLRVEQVERRVDAEQGCGVRSSGMRRHRAAMTVAARQHSKDAAPRYTAPRAVSVARPRARRHDRDQVRAILRASRADRCSGSAHRPSPLWRRRR